MQHEREPMPRRPALIRVGLMIAICFFFASMMPGGLILATFSSLLTLVAFATALLAAVLREPVWAGYVTRWDQACVLLALSLIMGWAVDPEAAAEALAQLETAAPASS